MGFAHFHRSQKPDSTISPFVIRTIHHHPPVPASVWLSTGSIHIPGILPWTRDHSCYLVTWLTGHSPQLTNMNPAPHKHFEKQMTQRSKTQRFKPNTAGNISEATTAGSTIHGLQTVTDHTVTDPYCFVFLGLSMTFLQFLHVLTLPTLEGLMISPRPDPRPACGPQTGTKPCVLAFSLGVSFNSGVEAKPGGSQGIERCKYESCNR